MTHETAKGLNALLDDLSKRLGVSREEVLRRAIRLIEHDLDQRMGCGVQLGRCGAVRGSGAFIGTACELPAGHEDEWHYNPGAGIRWKERS